MLVDRGEEILFNIVIDLIGVCFGGLLCKILMLIFLFCLNMILYVFVVFWNVCLIK